MILLLFYDIVILGCINNIIQIMSHQRTKPKQFSASVSFQSFKDQNVHHLIESIQQKLSMIASGQTPIDQISEITHQDKTANRKMNVKQLQTSIRKTQHFMNQSRVINRINQMQQYYMGKIKELNYQIVFLQNTNEKLKQQNQTLRIENQKLQANVFQSQDAVQFQVNKKLEEIKDNLISKFTRQAQQQYAKYIGHIKQLKQEANQQRKLRKNLQQQMDYMRVQKENLEHLYRDLLQGQKRILQADIARQQTAASHHKSNCEIKSNSAYSHTVLNHKPNKKISSASNKKKKNSQHPSQQQIIPMLAKGIEELKQRLNIK